MLRRLVYSVFVLCIAVTTGSLAQQSVTMTGQYSTIRISTDTVISPSGSAVVHATYGIVIVSEDPGDIFRHGKGDCVAASVLSDDGATIARSGWCLVTDMDGDAWSQWWKQDESGTPDCPIMCGTWGGYNGVGKFENISISGTFGVLASFADGSNTGTSEATYERR